MKILTALVLFVFSCNVAFANINMTVSAPELTDSILNILASVQSTYEITSVTASITGNQDTLNFISEDNDFQGFLSLSGLPKGVPLQVIVTATDYFNNQQSDTLTIIYAPPPKVFINLPLNWSSTEHSIPLKASCSGTGPCTITITYNGNPSFSALFGNTVDTVINLQSVVSSALPITFTAKDQWGQTASGSRTIFFDSNPYLQEIYSVNGIVSDFNYNKILSINNSDTGIITDITTNIAAILPGSGTPYNTSYNQIGGTLTPNGAAFQGFDIYNNSLYTMPSNPANYVGFGPDYAAGQYATFWAFDPIQGAEFYLRYMPTNSDTLLTTSDEYFPTDVATNGVVVYTDGYDIYKFSNDKRTSITNDGYSSSGSISNSYPVTDGNYVVYMKEAAPGGDYVYMDDGNSEIELGLIGNPNLLSFTPQSGLNFQVNNKYVAYTDTDPGGNLQVWLRDSTGAKFQESYFGSSSSLLKLLNTNGDIIFTNGDTSYLIRKGATIPQNLGILSGTLICRDSSWYILEGRYIYKLLIDAYITSTDGYWTNTSSWENDAVPLSNADVIVRNNIIVNANVSCNSLKVIPPGSVTVLSGYNLTVLH